jgi:DNA-binding NarL/FixJ family response regulator
VSSAGPDHQRVLIIDDHAVLAHSLALTLRQDGFDVRVADLASAEEILRTTAEFDPKVVLLDFYLGEPLGTALSLIPPLTATRAAVLVITGETDEDRLCACVAAGASGLASKAQSFDTLVDLIRRAAAGEDLVPASRRSELIDRWTHQQRLCMEKLAPFGRLTGREQEVLVRLMKGESAVVISQGFYTSLATVRSHIRSILNKLGVRSQLEAVALARESDWPSAG